MKLSHPLVIEIKAVTPLPPNFTGLISAYVSSLDNKTLTAFCLYLDNANDPRTRFARDNDDFKDDDDDFLFSFISSSDDYVQRGFGFFFDDIIIF